MSAQLFCTASDGDPTAYSGPTPGPMGLNDASDPTRSEGVGVLPSSTPGSLGVGDMACALATGPLVLPESQAASSDMGPEAFMRLYRHLDVPYVDRATSHICHVEADVHIYVNAGLEDHLSNEDEKDRLQGIVRRCAREARGGHPSAIAADRVAHNVAIAHAYYGKAAPWEYRIYLAYALTFGRTTPATLVSYCDSNARLGVDCSGFVNAYLVTTGLVGRARDIPVYARNTARTSYAQVQSLDLLIWQGTNRHIAIVDRVLGSNRMRVVESGSSKGGLMASDYTVESVTGGVFTVDRGLNAAGETYATPDEVRIVAYE